MEFIEHNAMPESCSFCNCHASEKDHMEMIQWLAMGLLQAWRYSGVVDQPTRALVHVEERRP